MNKREADAILLACKKNDIFLTMRKEGSVYLVKFINRIEIKSFEEAKLITNGLVIEGRLKNEVKECVDEVGQALKTHASTDAKFNFSNYQTRKNRADIGLVGVVGSLVKNSHQMRGDSVF